jgi:hypothetical protein
MALLTEQAVYLQNGRVQFFGPTLDAIKRYEQESADVHRDSPLRTATLQSGDKTINVSNFSVHRSGSGATPITGEGCEIVFDAHFEHALLNPGFIVSICTTSGMELLRISTSPISGVDTGRCQGKVHCAVRLHELPLVAGTYILRAGVSIPNVEYIIPLSEIGAFEVEPSDVYKSGFMLDQRFGLLVSGHEWTIQKPASEVPQ